MASNSSRRGLNSTTTTTTSTTTTISQNRRPRGTSDSNNSNTASTSRNLLISQNGPNSPRGSNMNTNSTEPFPSMSADNPRFSQLSHAQTLDQYPLSSLALTNTKSNTSQGAPATSVSVQSRRRPIGIKRLESTSLRPEYTRHENLQVVSPTSSTGRRRSTSAPQRTTAVEDMQERATPSHHLSTVVEGLESRSRPRAERELSEDQTRLRSPSAPLGRSRTGSQRMRRVSDAARSAVSRISNRSDDAEGPSAEYNDGIFDILDVLDPEVSTLTTLNNVQNSLFVPDLGRWLNRRPTYELTQGPSYQSQRPTLNRGLSKPLPPTPKPEQAPLRDIGIPSDIEEESESTSRGHRLSLASVPSIASVVQDEHYAVLPHGVSLDGWSDEDKELLDDHVRHMLHSKREGFKRSMRAFGKYIRKPLGFFVTLYAVLITLFGLAWVLFLIGWISVGARQLYIINVIDNVLVALFAVVGDGLAPFRAVDTYHMGFIAYYHHLTEKIRKKRALPKLQDQNELPEVHEAEIDVEASLKAGDAEFSVLTPEQQKKLEHHQNKFSKSHSFYKPHETTTHHAFPHHLFVAIVILLDMHSILQIALGSCTWGISYHVRPKALTPTILSCSITVNITAGILIKVGDNKTRKKDVLMRMFRQQLTEEAMKRVGKQKENEKEDRHSAELGSFDEKRKEKYAPKNKVEEESANNRFSTATMRYPSEKPSKS